MKQIDLNCDLGEGGDDAALMPLITSANIACGGHAGDATSMRRAVELAIRYGINIGAHPSYEDRDHFGRVELNLPSEQLTRSIVSQIRTLQSIAADRNAVLRHIKPHGALYNVAIRNSVVAGAIVNAVCELESPLAIVTLPECCLADRANVSGVEVIAECFADRTYQSDGTLTPRSDPGALIAREIDAVDQVLWMVRDGCVRTRDGNWISMRAQTVCVHGDGQTALPMLRAIRHALAAAGVMFKAF